MLRSSFSSWKKWFCFGNKIRDNRKIFVVVAATKNFAAATKPSVDRTKHFVDEQYVFVVPILTNDFVSITKLFLPCLFGSLGMKRLKHEPYKDFSFETLTSTHYRSGVPFGNRKT